VSLYKRCFAWLVCISFLLSSIPAHSFYTWPIPTSDTIHDKITHVLVEKVPGFQEIAYSNITEWMDDQDIPGSDAFIDATNHFDDSQLNRSRQRLEDNRSEIIEAAKDAHRDPDALNKVYQHFGYLLHAAQDFYSHTNFVETQLNMLDNRNASPSRVDQLELVNWDTDLDKEYRSGYFYYNSVLLFDWEVFNGRANCIRNLKNQTFEGRQPDFLSAEDYCVYMDCGIGLTDPKSFKSYTMAVGCALNGKKDLLHAFLNKDGPSTAMGAATNVHGIKLYDFAEYLAKQETLRQWNEIEEQIRHDYAPEADDIIAAIKGSFGLGGPLGVTYRLQSNSSAQVNIADSQLTGGGTKNFSAQGSARVDWKTGEIAGRGYMNTGSGTKLQGDGIIEGVHGMHADVKSATGTDTAEIYITGWLADGGKTIKVLRIYTAKTEMLHATGWDGLGPIDTTEDTETRIVNAFFTDVPMDGSQHSNKPIEFRFPSGMIQNSGYETESVTALLAAVNPAGLTLPADYKKTRIDNGNTGPLAVYMGIPPPDDIDKAMAEAKVAINEAQAEMAMMQQEMRQEQLEQEPSDDPEEAQMTQQQEELMSQLSQMLESAEQNFDINYGEE